LAKGLKILINSPAAVINRHNVIGVKFDVQMRRGAAATGNTAESVPHEDLESKSWPDFSTVLLDANRLN